MRTLAIVGSGPAGFYTAEAALKIFGENIRIDILDRLPTPYGLIRTGVAPDHQSIKAVSQRYDLVAGDPRVRLVGGISIGQDVSIDELVGLYDDVVLAVGAPEDRLLEIEGANLRGVIGSAAFVGWYNGHPDFADLNPPLDNPTAIVIGNGNVAIDCARILTKTRAELQASDIVNHALQPLSDSAVRSVHLLGRRGPQQASFTLKEVGELGALERATPVMRPEDLPPVATDAALELGQRRMMEILRRFAARGPDPAKPVKLTLDFYCRPLRVIGSKRVEAVEVMKTALDADGRAVDTGETQIIPCGLVISAIGYRTRPIPGAPFDEKAGRFLNVDGLIGPGLWCVGWARRGPSGTIGTNRPDGFGLVEKIAVTTARGGEGPEGLDRLLAERKLSSSSFEDWQKINEAETMRARPGAPREKIVSLHDMRDVLRD